MNSGGLGGVSVRQQQQHGCWGSVDAWARTAGAAEGNDGGCPECWTGEEDKDGRE